MGWMINYYDEKRQEGFFFKLQKKDVMRARVILFL